MKDSQNDQLSWCGSSTGRTLYWHCRAEGLSPRSGLNSAGLSCYFTRSGEGDPRIIPMRFKPLVGNMNSMYKLKKKTLKTKQNKQRNNNKSGENEHVPKLKSLSPLFFFYFRRKLEAFTNHNILKWLKFLQSFRFFWDVKCTIHALLRCLCVFDRAN